MSEKNIKCIIRPVHEGSLLAKPPLMVNGKLYPYEYGKETTLPDFVVRVAERTGTLKVERLGKAKATEPESPADPLGNGDGAADGPGGADGGADSGEPEDAPQDEAHPLDHDHKDGPGGSLPHDPPALTGKTKDQLIAIAKKEGADLTGTTNNEQRIDAIEANREAKG